VNPLQVPQWGPYGERYLLTWHFYSCLAISLFIFPSESPVRGPPPCYLTGSPWTGILRHQSHWSIHSFIYLFIHSCMSAGVPKKKPSCIWGKTYGHRPWSPMPMEGLHTMGCGLVPQGDLQGSNSPRTMHLPLPSILLGQLDP